MAKIKTAAIEDGAVNESKVKLSNNGYLKARNAADDNDVNIIKVNASDEVEFASVPNVGANAVVTEDQLGDYQLASEKGQANGYAELDGSGKVPAAQLPSYVDDVLEYANFAAFPGTGETGKIYVAIDTAKIYRWSGSAYVEITPNPGTTDALTEGSTNLYFTNARAKAAAVVNSTSGNETDQAASVAAMKSYVSANAGQASDYEYKTLNGTDVSNGYIDLAAARNKILAVEVKGYPTMWLTDDYSVSLTGGAGGVTRITFAGDMSTLVSGDKVKVTYK